MTKHLFGIVLLFLQALLVGKANAKVRIDVVVPDNEIIWNDAYVVEVEKVLTITFACALALVAIILIFERYIELAFNKKRIAELELSIQIANKVNAESALESHLDRSSKIVFFKNPIQSMEGSGHIEKINHRSSKIKKNIERLDAEITDLENRNEYYRGRNSDIRESLTKKKAELLVKYGNYDADLVMYDQPNANVEVEVEGGVDLQVGADVELNAGIGLDVELDVGGEVEVQGDLEAELAAQGDVDVEVEVEVDANVEVEVEVEAEAEA